MNTAKREDEQLTFRNKQEAQKKAIEFIKMQVQGKLDSKTLQYQREYYTEKRDMTNQNLYFKLNHKVLELQKSVDNLAAREDLSN